MTKPVMKKEDIERRRIQALEQEERDIKEEKTKTYLKKHFITDSKQKEKVRQRLLGSIKDKNFLSDYEVLYENGERGWERGYTVHSNKQDGDIVWYIEGFRTNLKLVLMVDPIGVDKLFIDLYDDKAAELFDAIESAYKTQESLKETKEKSTIEIFLDSFFQRIK